MSSFRGVKKNKVNSFYTLTCVNTGKKIRDVKIEDLAKKNNINTKVLKNRLNTNRIINDRYTISLEGDHGKSYCYGSTIKTGELLDFNLINAKFYDIVRDLICNDKNYELIHKSYYYLSAGDSAEACFNEFMIKFHQKCVSNNPIVCHAKKGSMLVRSLIEEFYFYTVKNIIRALNAKCRRRITKNKNNSKIISSKKSTNECEGVEGISTEGLNDSLGKSHQVLLRELYKEDGSIKSYRKNTGKSIHKALRMNESLKLEALKHLIETVQPSKLVRKFTFAIRNLEGIKVKTEGNDKILYLLREFLIDQNVRIENIGEMRGNIRQVSTPCKRKFEHNT